MTRFIDAPQGARCAATITLRDGSAAQCGRYAKVAGVCVQHLKRRYIAVLRSNGARFGIARVTATHITVQGWQHRDEVTLRDFAVRYELKRVEL